MRSFHSFGQFDGRGRSLSRRSSAARRVASALLAIGLFGCSGEKGELVLALQTDMSLPEDVDTVFIKVKVGSTPVHDGQYQLDPNTPGSYRMPATLGIVAGEEPNAIVDIKVTALRTVSGVREARTVNKSLTTVPEDRVALLRVPIQWLSADDFVVALPNDGEEPVEYETTCEPVDGRPQTAVAGECQSAEVSAGNLPTFEPTQVFGGAEDPGSAGTCFPTEACFDAGFTVAPLPRATASDECIVELAVENDEILNFACVAARSGICGAGGCYVPLDKDDAFGWKELAPSAGSDDSGGDAPSELRSGPLRRYRLPTAVCDRLDQGRALSVIASSSSACAVTKSQRYPTCGPWSSVGGGDGLDADGDTYPGRESGGPDCNDRDDTVYPGAPESCDEKDNDCNGLVDDSCIAELPNSHHVDFSGTTGFVSSARYAIYQSFTPTNPLDLDEHTVTFTPRAGGASYTVSTGGLEWDSDEGELLVPPAGASDPSNCDDCYASVNLASPFSFYGAAQSVVYPSSNGYLTFQMGDSTYTESVPTFLQGYPRVSALFDDLDTRGGTTVADEIYVFTSSEKTVLTYRNIQHFSNTGTSNTFQFVLLAGGTIKISYDGIEDTTTGSLVGISPGSITSGETCAEGLTQCSGSCINLLADAANCGECGVVCPPGAACLSGACSGSDGGGAGGGGAGGAAGGAPPSGGTAGTSGTGGASAGGSAGSDGTPTASPCAFSAPSISDETTCYDYATAGTSLHHIECSADGCQCCDGATCVATTLDPLSVCSSEATLRQSLLDECVIGNACGGGCPADSPGTGAPCDASEIAMCTFADGSSCVCGGDVFTCSDG